MKNKPFMASCILATAITGSAAVACEIEPKQQAGLTGHATQLEIEEIRARVLRHCGLSPRLAQNKLPWYFFYEFGVELMNQGQADLAIENLQMTANLKAEPARAARMYGMWFVNYLPYYQISLAYSEMGQWSKAWDAITMSEQLAEFQPGDFDYQDFAELKTLIASKLKSES